MKKATDRQAEVLAVIADFHAVNGCVPTIREVGRRLGINSPNGVLNHFKALEKKGLLKREQGVHGRGRWYLATN